jgi:uncharacterized SAM-binding protein YcdF (DUF218 family)
MAEALEIMGVPRNVMILEDSSRNTYENAVESRRVLSDTGNIRILLVTSAIHMPRAVRLFERQGFEVVPAPTDFLVTDADRAFVAQPDLAVQLMNLLPRAEDMNALSAALKEYIGIAVYAMRGWL